MSCHDTGVHPKSTHRSQYTPRRNRLLTMACGLHPGRPIPIWGVQQYWAALELAQCCGYFFSLLLALMSGVVLTVLVVHFLPHLRTLFYLEGTCTVVKTVYTVQYSCGCTPTGEESAPTHHPQSTHPLGSAADDSKCQTAFYPCLLVYVLINNSSAAQNLSPDTREQLRWPVLAYEDEWQQINVFRSDEGREERCIKSVCEGDTRRNRDVIERYRLEMAVLGQHQQCWFDPSNLLHKGAVFRRNIAWTFSFHILFWPMIFILVGIVIFLVIFCFCKRRFSSSSFSKESKYMSGSQTVIVNMEKY